MPTTVESGDIDFQRNLNHRQNNLPVEIGEEWPDLIRRTIFCSRFVLYLFGWKESRYLANIMISTLIGGSQLNEPNGDFTRGYRKVNGHWSATSGKPKPGKVGGPFMVSVSDVLLPETLKPGERGAIIYPDIVRNAPAGYFSVGNGEFDPDSVRAALLLFDRLDSPHNSILRLGEGVPPGLEQDPICQRTYVELEGNLSPDLHEKVLGAAFEALNDREPGKWAVARSTQGLGLQPEMLEPQAGFLLKLYNALPIPDRSVPYEDVLNFKHRRRPELEQLRHHMEQLAIDLTRADFSTLAEVVAFEKFDRSLADFARISRETNYLKRLTSLEISFSWSNLTKSALVAAPLSTLTDVLTASAGGILSSLEITTGFGLKGRRDLGPFEYIFRAGKEL